MCVALLPVWTWGQHAVGLEESRFFLRGDEGVSERRTGEGRHLKNKADNVFDHNKRVYVSICHVPPGKPENHHTIFVSENAVNAHLAHGDYLGPCMKKVDRFAAITSPTNASTVSGLVVLEVNLTGTSDSDSVQYLINGEALFGAISCPPHSVDWHTQLMSDGIVTIKALVLNEKATAEDSLESEEIMVHVKNKDDGFTFDLLSPPIGGIVEGVVEISANISRPMKSAQVNEGIMPYSRIYLNIDGADVEYHDSTSSTLPSACYPIPFASSEKDVMCYFVPSFQLDTRKLQNGYHGVAIRITPKNTGMAYLPIFVENEETIVDVRPIWFELYLSPGENQTLGMKEVNNIHNDAELLYTGPVNYTLSTWPVNDSTIVSVDESGVVTALKAGVVDVVTEVGEFVHRVRVVVREWKGFPHFGKNGSLLLEHKPGESLFVRSMFGLRDEVLVTTDGLEEQLQDASINAIESGLHKTVIDAKTLLHFQSDLEGRWLARNRFIRDYDIGVHMFGDDTARYAFLLHATLTIPLAQKFIPYALEKAAESRRVIGIDMVDEVSTISSTFF